MKMKENKWMQHIVFTLLSVMVITLTVGVSALAAPTNLRQKDDSKDSVTIEWVGDNSKYYGVQIATDANFTDIVKTDAKSNTQSAYISGLSSGNTYYVRVGSGKDSKSCFTNWSEAIDVVTAPMKVSSVSFVDATDTTATVSWPAVPGATGYAVECNNEVNATADTSYVLSLNEGSHTVNVGAYKANSAGYVAWSASNHHDAYVSNVSPLTGKISTDNFGFSTAYTNINVYYIQALYSGHGFEVQGMTSKGKSQFIATDTDNSVRIEKKFQYNKMNKFQVRAYVTLSDGNKKYGDWSDYKWMVVPKKCSYIAKGGKIKLSWNKLSDVSKIKIKVSTQENGGFKTCGTISGKKTGYTITKCGKKSLKKGKRYYFKIIYYAKGTKKPYESLIYSKGSVTMR